MNSGTTQLTASLEDFMLPCFNKELLGVECPGCGIQRAVALVFQGEFAAAFFMYPAIYTLLLLFGFLLADQFFVIRYANKISITLMVATVLLILTNFLLKFI
jgi:hypothetical protein